MEEEIQKLEKIEHNLDVLISGFVADYEIVLEDDEEEELADDIIDAMAREDVLAMNIRKKMGKLEELKIKVAAAQSDAWHQKTHEKRQKQKEREREKQNILCFASHKKCFSALINKPKQDIPTLFVDKFCVIDYMREKGVIDLCTEENVLTEAQAFHNLYTELNAPIKSNIEFHNFVQNNYKDMATEKALMQDIIDDFDFGFE